MSMNVGDVVQIMNAMAPPDLAEAWDNVGLQVGQMGWPVRSIWVALDPTPGVIAAACRSGADLLITHHPLIFKPLRQIDFASPEGQAIQWSVRDQIAIFAAHTNLDSAKGGLNDLLARKIGLTGLSALKPRGKSSEYHPEVSGAVENLEGLGRIGSLDRETTLKQLAVKIKATFGLDSIQMAGRPDLTVREVAVCTGSGGGLLPDFLASAADVYVSGDLTYHNGRDVEALNRGLIDMGHFASEHIVVKDLSRRLREAMAKAGEAVTVTACPLEKEPFLQV